MAIVDSRNVHGWAGRVLGRPSLPTVAGVVRALRHYGFDIGDVYVSIALASGRGGNERLQRSSEHNRVYRDRVLADARGHHLAGELRSDGEKRVDVRCAVEICRHAHEIVTGSSTYRAIVVLSHDTDLVPALDYANGLGVPAFMVTADSRANDDSRPWLMLGEAALRELVEAGTGLLGNDLRRAVAGYAMTPRVDDWYVEAEQDHKHRRDGQMMVRAVTQAPRRVPGVAPPGTAKVGAVLSWWSAGVNIERKDSFPYVELARQRPSKMPTTLHTVSALARLSVTHLLIEHPTQPRQRIVLDVPPGGPIAKSTVLVAEDRSPGMAVRFRYVAHLSSAPVPAIELAWAVLGRVTGRASATSSLATTADGHELLVRHAPDRPLTQGAWYALWVINPSGEHALALSSPLPMPLASASASGADAAKL